MIGIFLCEVLNGFNEQIHINLYLLHFPSSVRMHKSEYKSNSNEILNQIIPFTYIKKISH